MGAPPRGRREPAILDAVQIARVLDGFREQRPEEIATVEGWIAAVVHGGSWRFKDAEAVRQDVLLRVLRAARGDKVREPGGFQKFVQTVAKHVSVTVYHRERREASLVEGGREPEEVPGGADPRERLDREERLAALGYVVQRLSEDCRRLWSWVYLERRSAAEVGERLGISEGNVRVRVHRCLSRARELYRSYADWPGRAEAP